MTAHLRGPGGPPREAAPGLLHPLRHPAFALIAGATLVSNVGAWMRDTTSAWTVANETAHHSSVALVQAATMIPTFLLALPAGVLADHFDRRRICCETPDKSWRSWSIARIMVVDGKRMAGIIAPNQHVGMVRQAWTDIGQDMPFALALGAQPVIPFVGGIHLP